MSNAYLTAAWKLTEVNGQKLNVREKIVLAYLADRANDLGKAWPRLHLIAEATSYNVTGVQRALKSLEAKTVIIREKRVGKSDVFRFNPNVLTPVVHDRTSETTPVASDRTTPVTHDRTPRSPTTDESLITHKHPSTARERAHGKGNFKGLETRRRKPTDPSPSFKTTRRSWADLNEIELERIQNENLITSAR